MKRIFFFVPVTLFLIVFSWICLDHSVPKKVMKIMFTSQKTEAPTESTTMETLIPKIMKHIPNITVLRDLQGRLPNLPVLSWFAMKNKTRSEESDGSECSIYPDILDIEYSNRFWQLYRHEDATFYLYSAILGK